MKNAKEKYVSQLNSLVRSLRRRLQRNRLLSSPRIHAVLLGKALVHREVDLLRLAMTACPFCQVSSEELKGGR